MTKTYEQWRKHVTRMKMILAVDFDKILDDWCEERTARGWIDVREKMPEHNGEYLTLWDDNGKFFCQVSTFFKNSRNYGDMFVNNYSNGKIAFWQSISDFPSYAPR
jgi:hypothetical protein